MMAATIRAMRTVAINTATTTPTIIGIEESSGPETLSLFPLPASAVGEGDCGNGTEVEWDWEALVCLGGAV